MRTFPREREHVAEPHVAARRVGADGRLWTAVTAIEVLASAAAVLLDLLIPSLVMLALAGLSLVVRHEGWGSLGFARQRFGVLAGKMLLFAGAWSLFQLALAMPVANHVSGQEQDVSGFADLEGNVAMLALMLVLGWTLGALAEETAYRGYLLTRMRGLFGGGRAAVVVAVLMSSLLFGVAHTEQGLVGVLLVTLDGIAFSFLRYHYRTLWASVLAHGFNNTIGFVAFFLVGPVGAFW
jgi:membrane protease YdiL (CAAX protease family)